MDNKGYDDSVGSISKNEKKDRNDKLVYIEDGDDESWINLRKLWKFTGPGFLMSIAYLDPGNIESDLQSGAVASHKLIWVLLVAHALGLLLQRLSARLGVVTGRHMAEIAYSYYSPIPRICLWIMVELAIIASDMQEVIGTAISLYLLSNAFIPLWVGVIITILDTFSFLLLERYGVRYFEAFFCFLISCMAIAFGYEFVRSSPEVGALFTGMFLPWCENCGNDQIVQAISVIGAVVMPHNFYLHSALVKSRAVDRCRKNRVTEANKYYFIESTIALLCSFIINVFVISVFAKGFYGKSNEDVLNMCVNTENEMPEFYRTVFKNTTDGAQADIYHAGIYLGCSFGVGALYVWAVGILAAGQSSTMTGTYAGQFAMEGFIRLRLPPWKRLLITRSLAIAPTLAVTIFSGGIEHITGLNDFLNCTQMLQLPFAVLPVLTFASDRKIMHEFSCSLAQRVFAGLVSLIIIAINVYFFYDWVQDKFGFTSISIPIVALLLIVYGTLIAYLSYYCLMVMGLMRERFGKLFPSPKYEDFLAPWLVDNTSESTERTT